MKKFLLLLMALLLMPTVVFAAPVEQPRFSDISGHWGQTEIEQIFRQGIMQGIGDGKFAPDEKLTRAQLAVCLVRVFDLNMDNLKFIKAPSVTDIFKDTADGQWYSQAVMIAHYNHIFNETGDLFRPGEPVTRLETARAVANSFKAKNISVIATLIWPNYSDVEGLSREELNDLAALYNYGIMKGESNKFRPADYLTRAEAAAVFNRTINVINNSTGRE